jgi:hypothetical protein
LGKPLILSETGLPSGVDYTIEGTFYRPVHDNDAFASAYEQLTEILMTVNEEYHEQIMGIYIYEWLDNHHHPKIQLENSPIHNCFGLADENGIPKFDLSTIHTMTRG